MKKNRIGVMGAMPQEIDGIASELFSSSENPVERGKRAYQPGMIEGNRVVLAYTRCGKVAAATTAAHMILEFGVSEILFTGVAGAADPKLRRGDVVIGTALYQHDMDARPLFPRHEIPLLGVDRFNTGAERVSEALLAAERFLSVNDQGARVLAGEIASGDKFFASAAELQELKARLPGVACVEMEGAAVAQVCHEYGVPLTVIRTISDSANEESPMDFSQFIETIASRYSRGILRELLRTRSSQGA